jgi:hypothetical protein
MMRKLMLPLLLMTLGACGAQSSTSGTLSAETCATPETFSAIQKILFDDLRKKYPGNVKYINDMDNLFEASIYAPTLQDINKDTNKADCQGRLTLPVPSSLSEKFGRQSSLTADIGYTIQPSADGNGFVYTLGGYDEILQSMLNAASAIEGADKSGGAPNGNHIGAAAQEAPLAGSGEAEIGSSAFAGMSCYDLWHRRNQIFAENGYCFKSQRGIQTFGNSGCYTDTPDPPMYQQREVEAIKAQERRMACSIQ